MANKFYAVHIGLTPGIYNTWPECEANVKGYPGALYKSFKTKEEAKYFVDFGVEPSAADLKTKKVLEKPKKSMELPESYAFIDGSFNSMTDCYGYGGFLVHEGITYPLTGSGVKSEMSSMRNVAGEILGAVNAVRLAEELHIKDLTIYYDYLGIEAWATHKWKTNKTCTFKYANFMNDPSRSVNIHFEHVKGHSGIEGNEIADVLAKSAVGITLTKKQTELVMECMKKIQEQKNSKDDYELDL